MPLARRGLAALLLAVVMLTLIGRRALAADDYPYANAPYCTGGTACTDPWGFYYRQCTSFLAWRMNRDGVAFTNGMKGPNGKAGWWGNAGDWDANARQIGFPVDSTPAPGAIAQWESGEASSSSSGHVAYVEAVNADGSQVVEEYNAAVRGGWSRRTVKAPRFIHVHDGPAGAAVEVPARLAFAEGTTRPGFAEYLSLLNPGVDAGPVHLEYQMADGSPPIGRDVTVAAESLVTLDTSADVGAGMDFSLLLTGPPGLAATRVIYIEATFNGTGPVTGVTELAGAGDPSVEWDLAEGTTLPGFQEYLTLQNPTDDEVTVTVAYGFEGSKGPVTTHRVPGRSRATLDVAAPTEAGLGQTGVSAHLTATAPIAVERPLYFHRAVDGPDTLVDGSHVAPGGHPATTWLFAEGTVLPRWWEFLTLSNPATDTAYVFLHYLPEAGPAITRTVEVAAGSRRTVAVFRPDDPAGLGRTVKSAGGGVSIEVVADRPVLAERPLYTRASPGGLPVDDGHDALGAVAAAWCSRFAGADPSAGSSYLTVANPSATTATIAVTGYAGGASQTTPELPVAPMSRVTLDLSTFGGGPMGVDVVSANGVPFVAEQPQYLAGPTTGDGGAAVVEPTACG